MQSGAKFPAIGNLGKDSEELEEFPLHDRLTAADILCGQGPENTILPPSDHVVLIARETYAEDEEEHGFERLVECN